MSGPHLTLMIEPERVTLMRADPGVGFAARAWSGAHAAPTETIEEESRALLRTLRRSLRRGALDESVMAGHGRLLFDLLLPEPVKRALRDAGGGLLSVVGPAGHVPWPLLHDGTDWLGLRWAIGELPFSTQAPARPGGAGSARLLLVGDPAQDLPAARYEGEALLTQLSQGGLACDLRLGPLRKADFLRVFQGFRLLHFAGHAEPADEAGPTGWRFADGRLGAAELVASAGAAPPWLVFANACRSTESLEMTRALLEVGVRHLIGTVVDLPDLPGADFAGQFYAALRQGLPVGEALRRARRAAKGPVWAAYRLFGDPGVAYFRASAARRVERGVRRGVIMALRRPARSSGTKAEAPEVFAERLEGWRQGLRERVARSGGRLLPGRGAVDRAVFGVPISYEQDALRAAETAMELHAAEPESVVALDAGPLVSTGADAVGEAALAAEAAVWQLGPGVYALPGAVERLGAVARWDADAEEGPRRLLGLGAAAEVAPPLVGRRAELARIEEAARQAMESGTPSCLTLIGPAGIGKSRLLEAALERIDDAAQVLRGASIPYDEVSPFAPTAGVLRDLLGVDEETGPERTRAALRETLKRYDGGPAVDPLAVLSIDALLAGGEGPRLSDREQALSAALGLPVDGEAEAGLVPAAVQELIQAAAARQPLVLVFEDLHWLPEAGLAVVDELAASLRGVPVLLIATTRPELLDRRPGWFEGGAHLRLDLGPLTEAEAERVLRQVLPEDADVEGLRARAEGNPLFLRELALAVGQGAGEESPPATVEAVMQARIDRRSPTERQVLRAAAILGRTFWKEGLERLLDEGDVGATLAELERRRFLTRDPVSELAGLSQWRFTHALMQEVAWHGLSERARRAWHGRAALWLAEEVDDAQDRWARIATHRAAAGDLARATEDWLQAAERAGFAPVEARRALARALECDDEAGHLPDERRGEVEVRVARLAQESGDLEDAGRRYDAAIGRSTGSVRAERMRRRAQVDRARGETTAARARLAKALSLLIDAEGEAEQVLAMGLRCDEAWLDYSDGDYEGSVARLEALLAGVPAGAHKLEGDLCNTAGAASFRLGDYDQARKHYQRALAAFEQMDDGHNISAVCNNLGILAWRQGDDRAAIRHYQRAVRIKAERGDRTGLAQAYNNLGGLYAEGGHYERAAGYLEESVRIRERSGHASLAVGYANLGEIYLKQGRRPEASDYLERAIALCVEGRGPGYLLPDAWRLLAELRLEEGDLAPAEEAARTALDLARDSADRLRAAVASRVLGELLEGAEAETHLREAVRILEGLDDPRELRRAYRGLAAHLGPGDEATLLGQAADALEQATQA